MCCNHAQWCAMWPEGVVSLAPATWLTIATLPTVQALQPFAHSMQTRPKALLTYTYPSRVYTHKHIPSWARTNAHNHRNLSSNCEFKLWKHASHFSDSILLFPWNSRYFSVFVGVFYFLMNLKNLLNQRWRIKSWITALYFCTKCSGSLVGDTEQAAAHEPRSSLCSSDQRGHLLLSGQKIIKICQTLLDPFFKGRMKFINPQRGYWFSSLDKDVYIDRDIHTINDTRQNHGRK